MVVSTDLTYDPSDPKSFRYTIIEDLTNPNPPPGPERVQVKRGTRVRMTIPDPRTTRKLVTITVTAHHRDKPDLNALARAIVVMTRQQVKEERSA